MRKVPPGKPWQWLAVSLLVSVSALLWALRGAGSAAPFLWTEGQHAAPTTAVSWVRVAKADTPAVVNISSTQVVKNPLNSDEGQNPLGPGDPFQEFYRHFFGDVPRNFRTHSLGSGFIIREDGYIVTNNHVVDGATEITVKLLDGRHSPAKLIGRDPKTDIALLKIEARNLPVVAFGDSNKLDVGEPVMAIGNPFGLEGTVTSGIVSAKGRVIGQGPYDDFIQTDASINPGNSGDPLVNAAGEVVGINTAIFTRTGGSMGIGFAIPVNEAKAILPQLEAKGHVTRGWLGVIIQPVTQELAKALHLPEGKGALVSQVMPDSPAAKAGLQAGDVIVAYEGHTVAKSSDLPRLVAATPIDRNVAITVFRDGRSQILMAKVADLSEPQQVAAAAEARGTHGLAVQPLTPELARQLGVKDRSGVVVAGVQDGSPADEAGVQPGDVIVQVDRKPVHSVADLRRALAEHKAGEPMLFQIHRKDTSLFVAIKIEGKPQG